MPWQTAMAVDSYRPNGEDRACVFQTPASGVLVVITDGVGGRSGGAAAADAVIESVGKLDGVPLTSFPSDRIEWLRAIDRRLAESGAAGETTAVVALLTDLGPVGVAVGDSVAWWVSGDTWADLTVGAARKPWVGSGSAIPVVFARPRQYAGTLLMATDGLVKYASPGAVCRVIRSTPFKATPRALIELVRYPSGRLPDDVAVIVARWSDS